MFLIDASLLGDRARSKDRGNIVLTEAFERGRVTEGSIDTVDAVQAGELDGVGHLHLDSRRAGSGGLNEPHSCSVTERQELALRLVASL